MFMQNVEKLMDKHSELMVVFDRFKPPHALRNTLISLDTHDV